MSTVTIQQEFLTHHEAAKNSQGNSSILARIQKQIRSVFVISELALERRIFYISNEGQSSNLGLSPNDPIDLNSYIDNLKTKLKAGDTLSFCRGQIFDCNDLDEIINNKSFFIEAYGIGDNPILKAGDKLIEVIGTSWF